MITIYPAVFFRDSDGYSAVFPDLNYLSTCGKTFEECYNMAIDCLAGYIYISKKENENNISKPSNPADIDAKKIASELNADYIESIVNMVAVDVEDYAKRNFEASVKKTLTIPKWLNQMALDHNINFSQVLQDALKAKLNIL